MPTPSRTQYLIAIAIGAILIVGAGFAFWKLRPVSVTVAKIEVNVPIQVFGLGTIEAEKVSKIGFETAGTVVELNADHGSIVQTGAVLGRLQVREQDAKVAQARAAVTQAKAGVAQAEAAVEKAETTLKLKADTNVRRQKLVERGVVSQQVGEDTEAAADVAKAELAQAGAAVSVARASVEQAIASVALEEARLAKYTLHAPFDGLIMFRHKDLGSALNANEAVFTIVDPATIWALAYFDEARSGKVEVGQSATLVRRSAPASKIPATVVRIDIESDRVNEERRVYVRYVGSPLTFHLGEQAEVLITMATLARARMVEAAALQDIKGRKATAWTLEAGLLQQRTVTLGQRTIDGRFEIVDGVPEGAEIVTGPQTALRAGRKAVVTSSKGSS